MIKKINHHNSVTSYFNKLWTHSTTVHHTFFLECKKKKNKNKKKKNQKNKKSRRLKRLVVEKLGEIHLFTVNKG